MLLYAITDRQQLPGGDKIAAVSKFVAAASLAGIDYIQLREKDLAPRQLELLACACMERVRQAREQGSKTRLLVNSRCDIAMACGADGVHLRSRRSGEMPAGDARAILAMAGMAHAVIGASCHSLEDVLLAESEGADFAVFGPVFGKAGMAGMGLEELRRVCARERPGMQVLALGGVSAANARDCARAGAAGVAGIRLFQQSELRGVVRSLREGIP
ncbi:MAG: thiamine phosphate synthase [Acidobacteria bacterium]|nr:thiamine phosphate synthase [Acidobacteriota bacterium]